MSDKPLIAILISPDGVEELWVLGREALGGKAAPEDIALGREWIERLGWLKETPNGSPAHAHTLPRLASGR